jgi:hypothetical protein
MKIVIFGLTISSSWGNGHATLWRGLCRALGRRGHQIVFFERDVPYYATHRDLSELPSGRLELYSSWESARAQAERDLTEGVVVGLPATIWFPDAVLRALPADEFWFLLFPVSPPELFDAVITDDRKVREIQAKVANPISYWGWGAFRLSGVVHESPV